MNSPIAINKPSCPICASSSYPYFYAGEHRVFRCAQCALSFVSPQPSTEYLREYYSQFHLQLEAGGGYELHENRIGLDFPAKLATLKQYLRTEKAKVLDVGCGKGFFVKACRDAGYDAEGIDLSDTAIAYATDVLGVKARQVRLEDLDDAGDRYDAVTFWATIEHLQDPAAVLAGIHKVLKPGGVLLLDTGIGNDWLDRWLPGVVQWYDPPQHLFVFSKESMRTVLHKTGFTVQDIDTCFERNRLRRLVRVVRGGVYALAARIVAEVTRTARVTPFQFTRFSVGNLMSVVARKEG